MKFRKMSSTKSALAGWLYTANDAKLFAEAHVSEVAVLAFSLCCDASAKDFYQPRFGVPHCATCS